MGAPDHETRVGFAVERLLGAEEARRALVRDMAAAWPDGPALALAFVLTDAAARIEAMLDSRAETRGAARAGYRMAALIAADVFLLEAEGRLPVSVADLRRHWERNDRFFLDL